MQSRDQKRFVEILTATAVLYGKDLNEMVIDLYYQTFEKYGIDDISAAFTKHIRSSKYFPKPAEIREQLRGVGDDLEARALQQATAVWNAIARVGHGSSVYFKDPVTAAVVKGVYGGWCKLASETKEAEQKWFIKDFTTYYQNYARAGAKCYEKQLGWYEHQNQLNGYYFDQDTYVIGSKAGEIKLLGIGNEEN